jgi:uncharacterized protein YbaR (Trm112 family)
MLACPCCRDKLMRHASNNRIYWFCRYCWQEMPNFSDATLKRLSGAEILLSTPVHK